MGHTPTLLYTFGLSPFGWALQGFSYVRNVTRDPLLGPPHNHTLYHAPTNRSDITLAHVLPG
jgi:hypothetical protein